DVSTFLTDLARWALSFAHASTLAGAGVHEARVQAAVAATGGLGLAALAFVNTRRRVPVKRVELTLENWPQALDGYRIVQLSDVHVSPSTDPAWTRDLVARANAEKPDLLALTGDLVDGTPAQLAPGMQPFAELHAKDGVYFVTGNHEYYS